MYILNGHKFQKVVSSVFQFQFQFLRTIFRCASSWSKNMSAKIPVVIVLCLLLVTSVWAQGLREYIYGGSGELIATEIGSVCAYSLSSSSANVHLFGGSGSFGVTFISGSGCSWSAVRNADWITISGGGSGTGSGIVNYFVSQNTGSPRVGTISVAGHVFTIFQAGMTCQEACSHEAQNITNQMLGACSDYCIQWLISTYPWCFHMTNNLLVPDACDGQCMQQLLSEHLECAQSSNGTNGTDGANGTNGTNGTDGANELDGAVLMSSCFDLLGACFGQCMSDAEHAGSSYYTQCVAGCN